MRALPNEENETLEELIPRYYQNKQECSSYEKLIDEDNKKIKELMADTDKYEVDGLVATVSTRVSESMDEQKLIEVLKANNITDGIIKTTEYVDMDALERVMYAGTIPESVIVEMNKCRISKETKVLKVTRKKTKKKENEDE